MKPMVQLFFNRQKEPSRFRQHRFQQRIKNARAFHRDAHISPGAQLEYSRAGLGLFGKFVIVLITVLLVIAAYFLTISDYFLVREVQVSGSEQINSDTVSRWMNEAEKKRVLGLIPSNNWLLLTRSNIENILLPKSSRILEISLSKRIWPNKLEITIKDRTPDMIWQSNTEYFYLSADSIAFEQISPDYATSTAQFLIITDITQQPVKEGDNLDASGILNFIHLARNEWSSHITSAIKEIRIPGRSSPDIYFASQNGWVVMFDLKSDPIKQIQNLQSLLTQEIPPEKEKNLSYIDLRLSNAAYYCYLDEPCAAVQGK